MSETVELICPKCTARMEFGVNCDSLQCPACANRYENQNKILLLSEPTTSWNLIPADLMKKMNSLASEDTWQNAINKLCPPRFLPIICEDGRADWKFLLNIDSGSHVLDFGSGLGAISMSLAREGASVIALDKTVESLEFVKIRTSQEGLPNVIAICYQGEILPFPDNSFDVIILNGVLEWVVSANSVCTNNGFLSERNSGQKYKSVQLTKQQALLRECHRILKDSGCVYIGIENRLAIKYFLSVPEDHMGIRFISLLPRWLADRVCLLRTGTPYIAKTFTKRGYFSLLKNTGFEENYFYMPVHDYRSFNKLVALDDKTVISYFLNGYKGESRWYYVYIILYKLKVLDVFANSYSIFALKGNSSLGEIFSPVVDKLGINKKDLSFYLTGRSSYRGSVSALLFHKNTKRSPIYIKTNKDPRDRLNIEREYRALLRAGEFCQSNPKGKVLKTDIYELDRGRKALVQRALMGKNLANHFLSLNYTRQIRTATLWLPELTKWLLDFHLKSTNLLKVNGDMVRRILSDRLDMAKKVDSAIGSNMHSSIDQIINNIVALDISLPIGLIHGDYSPINVLVERDDLYYVIDWEDANPEDCGLDDICNLFFSFGVRLRERKFQNRFITISFLYEFIRVIYRKLNSKGAKEGNMQNTADYTFYSDTELLTIMKQAWRYYSEKIGLEKEVIDWWFPLYIVKYAYLEISPSRNSLNKCKSWVNLFNNIKRDRFVFCQ